MFGVITLCHFLECRILCFSLNLTRLVMSQSVTQCIHTHMHCGLIMDSVCVCVNHFGKEGERERETKTETERDREL